MRARMPALRRDVPCRRRRSKRYCASRITAAPPAPEPDEARDPASRKDTAVPHPRTEPRPTHAIVLLAPVHRHHVEHHHATGDRYPSCRQGSLHGVCRRYGATATSRVTAALILSGTTAPPASLQVSRATACRPGQPGYPVMPLLATRWDGAAAHSLALPLSASPRDSMSGFAAATGAAARISINGDSSVK
jgi:hypothetical protein